VRRQVTNVVKSISGLIRDSIEVSLVIVLGVDFLLYSCPFRWPLNPTVRAAIVVLLARPDAKH